MTTETLTTPTEPRTPRKRTASDVLLAAARYIEEHGWTQGGSGTVVGPAGSVCAYLALDAVAPNRFDGAARMLWRWLGIQSTSGIFDWNDEPGRTEAEVLAALRAAATVS